MRFAGAELLAENTRGRHASQRRGRWPRRRLERRSFRRSGSATWTWTPAAYGLLGARKLIHVGVSSASGALKPSLVASSPSARPPDAPLVYEGSGSEGAVRLRHAPQSPRPSGALALPANPTCAPFRWPPGLEHASSSARGRSKRLHVGSAYAAWFAPHELLAGTGRQRARGSMRKRTAGVSTLDRVEAILTEPCALRSRRSRP